MMVDTIMVARELDSGSIKLGTTPGGGGAVGTFEGSILATMTVVERVERMEAMRSA